MKLNCQTLTSITIMKLPSQVSVINYYLSLEYVPPTSPILKQYATDLNPKIFEFSVIKEKLETMPRSNEEVIKYANDEDPSNLPTAVLIKLAELMRHRRIEMYEANDINDKVNKRISKLL